MSAKPRLLDLFSGAGGCARGYQLAGFHVTGVDNRPQPRYVGDAFILGDALDYCDKHGHEYDAIHASPPCKLHSAMQAVHQNRQGHISLVAATRDVLTACGQPFVLENVPGAPLRPLLMLCGSMFSLPLRRHRVFESSVFLWQLRCRHDGAVIGVYGHSGGSSKRDGLSFSGVATWREAMGIDWMTCDELAQAIPPKYTEFIGRQLLNYV